MRPLFLPLPRLLPKLRHPTMKNTSRTYLPPAQHRVSSAPLYLPRDHNHGTNGAECSLFCFCLLLLSNPLCLVFFFFFYVPRPNHRLNEHALLCFQAFLQKGECVSQECEKGKKKKKEAVCLCVALLDMTRDDIMGDAAAAAAGR